MNCAPRPRWLACVLATLGLATGAAAELPPEGQCPAVPVPLPGQSMQDAAPLPLHQGMAAAYDDLPSLSRLVPKEIWRHRNVFFHDGMRMEIGPCHRRYPVSDAYREATEQNAGSATLDRDGNLRGYVGGLPFPPDQIDPEAPDAGLRWAWNLELRHRGAGAHGRFRIVDMPSRLGSIEHYVGRFFFIQTRHRTDLAANGGSIGQDNGTVWIAGGRFEEPTNARHLAWRQMRPLAALTKHQEPDDTFVYVPSQRKMRRGATAWVDGMYTPRYRVASGDDGGGGLAIGSDGFSPNAAISPTAAKSIALAEHIPRGFVGMTLRPNAYVWRVLGEREVIAPINVKNSGWPVDEERNFGESGLSAGSDRWDIRWAVVIEGLARDGTGNFEAIVVYVDYQTQQPLYWVRKKRRGRIVDLGVLLYRFSGDQPGYPAFASGQTANVFDPVAALFLSGDFSGWRRESFGIRSTPAEEHVQRRFLASDYLERGK